MEDFLSVIEAARRLETDVEMLTRSACRGELTVFVIANEWAVQRDDDGPSDKLKGQVYLLADDVLQGIGAESIPVRQVRKPNIDEIVTLQETQQVRRGVIYLTTKEFDRFRRQHALALEFERENAPFLNPDHDWYATELAIAVQAWMALFADGTFLPRKSTPKQHIERWLSKNQPDLLESTRQRIATLVNPDTGKPGGVPKTLAE